MVIEHAPKETSDQLIDALSEEQIGELFDLLQESVDSDTSEFEEEEEETFRPGSALESLLRLIPCLIIPVKKHKIPGTSNTATEKYLARCNASSL